MLERYLSPAPVLVLLLILSLTIRPAAADYEESFTRGREAYENEEYENARGHLQDALSFRETTNVLNLLARVEYQLNQYERATERLRRSLELMEDQPDLYTVLGRILLERDLSGEARKVVNRAIETFGTNLDRFQLQAEIHRRAGRTRLAAQSLGRAHALAPGNRSLHLQYIQQLLRADRGEKAREEARALAAGENGTKQDLVLIARAALKTNQYDTAETHLEMARYLGIREPDLYRSLGDLHVRDERYRRGLYYYRQYMEMVESPTARDHYRMGLAYIETGEFESARHHLQQAYGMDPQYGQGIGRLARTLYEERGYSRANELLPPAGESERNHPQLRVVAGELALREELYDTAAEHFRIAHENGNRDRGFLLNYARSLLESSRQEQARQVITTGIARYPEENRFRSLLSNLLERGSEAKD